jgi:site-specific DNA-methyltransferase (adenine-specific)
MSRLPEACIPLVVSSPPYDDTFIYGGHTWNFEVFKKIADQLWRVVMPGGVVCWVVEDQHRSGGFTCSKYRQALYFKDLGFQMYEELYIQRTGITHHQNRYPEQITNCFVLSKSKPRYIARIGDRPNVTAGDRQRLNRRYPDGSRRVWQSPDGCVPIWGLRTNLWKVKTGRYHTTRDDVFTFYALMPEELAQDLIVSYSRPKDLVLDPFSGAGTTGKMAKLNFRNYLGFEIWDEAYKLSVKRLEMAKAEYQKRLDRILAA